MRAQFRIAILTGLVCFLAFAQENPVPVETTLNGVIRDALANPVTDEIFLTLYDKGELWRIDPANPANPEIVRLNKGICSMAIQPARNLLACVNRIAGTVALVDLSSLKVLNEIPWKAGVFDIVPWQDNGFLFSDSFGNALVVLDPSSSIPARVFVELDGVPGPLATSDKYLAVGRRVPPSVVILAKETGQLIHTIDLPTAPKAVESLANGRFVIQLPDGLWVVDGATGEVTAKRDVVTSNIGVRGEGIFATLDKGFVIFDAALMEQRRFDYSSASFSVIVPVRSSVALVEPATQKLWYRLMEQVSVSEVTEPAADQPSVAPTPIQPMEIPAVSSRAEDASPEYPPEEVSSAEKPETPPRPEKQTVSVTSPLVESASSNRPAGPTRESVPATRVVHESTPEKTDEIASTDEARPDVPAAERTVSERGPSWKSFQKTPLAGKEVLAPRFSRSRPGLPGSDAQIPGIAEALTSGFDLSSIGGSFEQPDWRRPWRDITADEIQRVGDEQVRAVGNVQLTLDTLHFKGDELYYNDTLGEMDARGNVVITQNNSVLTADRLYYKIPSPSEVAEELKPFPLTSEQAEFTDEELARKRLSLGKLGAENVYISEPYRELEAERFEYDFASRSGVLENASGHVAMVYFGALRVRVLGPVDAEAEEVWVTTCDHDPPHYRIRVKRAALVAGESFKGEGAQLQIGSFKTPLYWPRWAYRVGGARTLGFDFDSGRAAKLGYYMNYAHHFMVSPELELGLRLYPTQKQGVGFGFEGIYDYTKAPASPLFLGSGEFRTMLTTKENGYVELYHRHELIDDTILLLQWEQWFERDFVKDFYYEVYRHRTEPRTFANVTHTQPDYIATATVRKTTNDFVAETERAPEVTFHLLEKPLVDRIYLSFDTVAGYNEREPAGQHAARWVNVARTTVDLDLSEAFSVTPFLELEGSWYSRQFDEDKQDTRFSALVGITTQTRFHRTFPGFAGFSGFKHLVVPSITLSYRPDPTMGVMETPRFDAYDNVYGRTRLETKIDNILMGRDAETDEVWQVARLTLYQGNDFRSEVRKSDDYEMELDIRPRPWWGVQLAAEKHHITKDFDLDAPFWFERLFLEAVEDIIDRPVDPEEVYRYNAQYGDYERILSYIYYDDRVYAGRFNARIGFAYTKTRDQVFNREILYGMGYKLGEKWSVAFEHRYDFERDELMRQVYELRRNLHCWEAAVQFRERTEGWDVGFELSLVGFPSTKVKF